MYFNKASSVFRAIEDIAATASKKEKEAILKAAGTASPLFMKVVTYAYDPFRIYGIGKTNVPKKRPAMPAGANTLDESVAWTALDKLAAGQVTGDAARILVQNMVDLLDEPSSELFRRILMGDMRAGFTDGTINRVFKGTIAEFPYMRCSLPDKSNMDKWDWSVGIIIQEKADGMFTNVNLRDDGFLTLTTRQGTPIPMDKLPELVAAIHGTLKLGTQSHGELTVYEDSKVMKREEGNGVLNHICAGGAPAVNQRVVLELWDQIPLSAVAPKGKHTVGYKQRLTGLIKQLAGSHPTHLLSNGLVRVIPTKIVKSLVEAKKWCAALQRAGKEGLVAKHPEAIWFDGTSKDQVKFKLEVVVDLEVEAILPGDIGSKNEGRAGRLLMKTSDGLLKVNVAVKNEAMRDACDATPEKFIGGVMPVKSNGVMEPGDSNPLHSLFLPRFVEVEPRIDKSVADTLEQVQDQFRNAVEGEELAVAA